MLVVGDREAEAGAVSVRRHGEGDEGSRRAPSDGARRGALAQRSSAIAQR